MTKLLIIGCSESKATERRRAIDLYRSRQHRLAAAAYDADAMGGELLVDVLSAKEGLVDAGIWIAPYDEKMTAERAEELKSCEFNRFVFVSTVTGFDVDEVLVYGGALYRDVVAAWASEFDFPVTHLVGAARGCGDHYSALKEAL